LRRNAQRYLVATNIRELSMKFLVLAAVLGLAGCATVPANPTALQETASLMTSIGQHGEGADIADTEAQLNALVASAPNDPFVLKLASATRRSLSDHSQDRAERVRLRHTALEELDRAIALAKPAMASRIVMISGQETEIDLKDLPDLRAQMLHQVQTDR
jgi:hypothetical protein